MPKAILDKLQEKWVSRKLLVFLIATIFMILGIFVSKDLMTAELWTELAKWYIVTQGGVDGIEKVSKVVSQHLEKSK